MSQQEMEFESSSRDEPKSSSSYAGYVGWEPYHNAPIGQKLSGQAGPSWNHRLALAIVSLCLWVVVLLSLVGIGLGLSLSNHADMLAQFAPVLVVGILCMSGVVIIVNVIFNRRH